MTQRKLSAIVEHQIKTPSPIREIMKMADRENIVNMGLNPEEFISFGGGWVGHRAPERLREIYAEVCKDADGFDLSGGYSPTLGERKCREELAEFERNIFSMKNIGAENIIIGQSSTQLTHDLLRTLLNPGDNILLFDPTYANYFGQLFFSLPLAGKEGEVRSGVHVSYLDTLDVETWQCFSHVDDMIEEMVQLFELQTPKMVLFPSPDNPTSIVTPQSFVEALMEECEKHESFLVIDFAYKTQHFAPPPAYFSWSPRDHPYLVSVLSNSKWGRGLGRRLGWVEASEDVIAGLERVQQVSILCPDTLHQMALAEYLDESLSDGSLRAYLDEVRASYENASKVTLKGIDGNLGMKRTVPDGGLYTVMNVERDGDEFVMDIVKNTGVLFVPGRGFGKTLREGVRVSYGPLVNDTEKIKMAFERVGEYIGKS